MNIVAYDSARVTFLFSLEETIPLAGVDTRSLFESISQRYDFAVSPELSPSRDDVQRTGFQFSSGRFLYKDAFVDIANFSVYTDGIVATSVDTDVAEAFVEDAIGWLIFEKSFRHPASSPRRFYQSHIVFDMDASLDGLAPHFQRAAGEIHRRVSERFPHALPAMIARLEFDCDHSGGQSTLPIPRFTIERRANVSFDRNRYFSSAPLKTGSHVDLLRDVSSILAQRTG